VADQWQTHSPLAAPIYVQLAGGAIRFHVPGAAYTTLTAPRTKELSGRILSALPLEGGGQATPRARAAIGSRYGHVGGARLTAAGPQLAPRVDRARGVDV